jgi:cytochrome c-type biogenesis protein CcmH/NrfG
MFLTKSTRAWIVAVCLTIAPNLAPAQNVPSVAELIEGLEQKLEGNPTDMKGWVLLGRSYHHLQNWQKAEEAFNKARELGYQGDTPKLPNVKSKYSSTHPLLRRKEENLQILQPLLKNDSVARGS